MHYQHVSPSAGPSREWSYAFRGAICALPHHSQPTALLPRHLHSQAATKGTPTPSSHARLTGGGRRCPSRPGRPARMPPAQFMPALVTASASVASAASGPDASSARRWNAMRFHPSDSGQSNSLHCNYTTRISADLGLLTASSLPTLARSRGLSPSHSPLFFSLFPPRSLSSCIFLPLILPSHLFLSFKTDFYLYDIRLPSLILSLFWLISYSFYLFISLSYLSSL